MVVPEPVGHCKLCGGFAVSKLNWLLRKDLRLVKEIVYKISPSGRIKISLSIPNLSGSIPKGSWALKLGEPGARRWCVS